MELEAILSLFSRITIALSGICIITGVVLVKTGRKETHKRVMIAAAVLALIFVSIYIVKSSMFPPERYAGAYRSIYLFILWSHTVLSLVNLPLAAITIFLGLKGRYTGHKRIAPYTAGVWIYVAFTGWLIFFFH